MENINAKSNNPVLYSILTLCAFMLLSLFIMSDALRDTSQFSRFYSGLLTFNAIGLGLLLALIFVNVRKLVRQYLRKIPGSRMTVRMICMFTALSVTPVIIVYLFSLDFLHRGIDSWFDLRVEQALDDSLQLSRLAIDVRMKELLAQTEQITEEISGIPDAELPLQIDKLRDRSDSKEITLFNKQGRVVISSSEDATSIIPDKPNDAILLQLQQGNSYAGLNETPDTGLHIRVAVNVPGQGLDNEPRIIQALYPISAEIDNLTNNIEHSYTKYKELSYLREQLKLSFILILTLVLLFSILATIWSTFYFSRKHVAPIKDMAKGTESIAKGDYHTHIPVPGNDELGSLVKSFNEMTQKIASARDAADRSRHEVEAQKAYFAALLGNLSSGVLVFDQNDILRTVNISATRILEVDSASLIDSSLPTICSKHGHLRPLQEAVMRYGGTKKDWHEQITLTGGGGRQILMCNSTPYSLVQDESTGYIIVLDDVTKLIQGQKNAAWSEIARRLAHEIKNPLTPIQLATERLKQKYLPIVDPRETQTLERLTNTITQQVNTIKEMVNTFSDFARPPEIEKRALDINELILEILDLFTHLDRMIRVDMELASDLPLVEADPNRLRQVFNNLLKNAFDNCRHSKQPVLKVTSNHVTEDDKDYIEISINDSGPGIKPELMEHVFEPYFTTKTVGTGLGLAIVKKIVEEHHGLVWLENKQNGAGISAVTRFPVIAQTGNSQRS